MDMLNQDFLEVENNQNKDNQFLSPDGQNNFSRNTAVVVILVVVILAGGYFIFRNSESKKLKPQEIVPKPLATPEVARVSADNLQKELPQDFPKDIPLNGKVKIIESYSMTYLNSTAKQSTISFESSKSIKENYDFYTKWTKDNEWGVANSPKQDNLASLYGQKNQATLNIVIIPKISGKIKSEVNITYGGFRKF